MAAPKIQIELDVDGIQDPNHDITYIGKATRMDDGTWRCLANAGGSLCIVEVNIKHAQKDPRSIAFCCSFCGCSAAERDVIIAGPTVNICDECNQIVQDLIDDEKEKRKQKGKTTLSASVLFVSHIKTGTICETCENLIPPENSVAPWWDGACAVGFRLNQDRQTCASYHKKAAFTSPPGEFSGCRCPHCPERDGTGECSCCAERREEEKNPGPDPFV